MKMTGDYLSCYLRRRFNNHEKLMSLAKDLKKQGFEVFSTQFRDAEKDSYRHLLYITKNGKQTYLWFGEVPYCWRLDGRNNSHPSFMEGGCSFDIPFTIEDIERSMIDIPEGKRNIWTKL